QAICRRSSFRPAPRYHVGDIELDLSTRKVTRGSVEIELSPTEFSILEFLMRHAGHVVTRKMLNEHIWGEDWQGITNVVDVHINRLRRKLDRGGEDSLIHTVRGRGYVFRTAEAGRPHDPFPPDDLERRGGGRDRGFDAGGHADWRPPRAAARGRHLSAGRRARPDGVGTGR